MNIRNRCRNPAEPIRSCCRIAADPQLMNIRSNYTHIWCGCIWSNITHIWCGCLWTEQMWDQTKKQEKRPHAASAMLPKPSILHAWRHLVVHDVTTEIFLICILVQNTVEPYVSNVLWTRQVHLFYTVIMFKNYLSFINYLKPILFGPSIWMICRIYVLYTTYICCMLYNRYIGNMLPMPYFLILLIILNLGKRAV